MEDAAAQKILNAYDKNLMLALLDRLVRIPSFKNEETPAARFLAGYFKRRGYQVELQEVDSGRYQVIATLKGAGGGKSLMFNGHIEINALALGWKRDPWTPFIEGDRFYGAGTFNMKGGLTAMIAAAEAVRKSGIPLKGDLAVACVVGETAGGEGTVHMLQQGLRTDAAIVTEPYGTSAVTTVHCGILHFCIHTYGVSRHISQTEGSINALDKMIKVVNALKEIKMTYTPRPDLPALPRMQVGGVISGRGPEYDLVDPHFVPDFSTAFVDVHFVHGQTVDSILADVRRTLEPLVREDPQLRYEIQVPPPRKFRGSRQIVMESFEIPANSPIVQTVARCHERVAGAPVDHIGATPPLSYAASDTCHLYKAGIPCCIYGPGGGWDGADEPDNYVLISEMEQCVQVLALSALEWCGPKV